MFGYIRPLECELKVREQAEYRAFYCGLCKTIGTRYGLCERLSLSYDCAFLAAFLSALSGGAAFYRGNCMPRCYRGGRPIASASPELDYAADVNVLLAWYQSCDDVLDEGRLPAVVSRAALRRAFHRAARRHAALDGEIRGCVSRLREIEKKNVASTDEPSDAFGTLLSAVIRRAPMLPQGDAAACGWMFYNLGKWVYLIDAWDDREDDKKRGGYNPFLSTNMDADAAEFLLNVTLAEAEKGYDLLTIDPPSGLIENIMRLGMRSVQRRVLRPETAACAGRAQRTGKGEAR